MTLNTELFAPHGQHVTSKRDVGTYPDSRWCSLIRLPLRAKGVRNPTLRVDPFLADTANAAQQDGWVTIRFRNALSGEHLDERMRDLGAYSPISRAFDLLESKIGAGNHYGSYVQAVPPITLTSTFADLKESPESDGALLIQYLVSELPSWTGWKRLGPGLSIGVELLVM